MYCAVITKDLITEFNDFDRAAVHAVKQCESACIVRFNASYGYWTITSVDWSYLK